MTKRHVTQSAALTSQRGDIWVRMGWIWHLLFYIGILIPILLSYSDSDNSTADQRNMLLLAGGMALWHLVGVLLLPRRFPKLIRYPAAMSVVMIGIVVFWVPLVRIHPAFYFTMGGLFSQVFT
jgi:hypothetical protein